MVRGSVTRRNGGWCIRFDAGVDPRSGRRRQLSRQGYRTKRDAVAALIDLQVELDTRGSVSSDGGLPVGAYLAQWLDRSHDQLRASTVSGYRKAVAHVTRHLGEVRLRSLSPLHVQRFEVGLLTGQRPLSAKTVANIHAVFHRALADAERLGLIDRNPAAAVDPPRPPHRELTVWNADHLRRFLDSIRGHRLYAAFVVMATTGMRRSELLGLHWDDVDFDVGATSIRRNLTLVDGHLVIGPAKATSSRRLVHLDAATLQILRDHQVRQRDTGTDPSPWVFLGVNGQPVNPASFNATFDRLVTRSDLPRIRLHDLRHTYATLALRAGVHPAMVSDRLGHASIAVTYDLYSHMIPGLQGDAADAVAQLLLLEPSSTVN